MVQFRFGELDDINLKCKSELACKQHFTVECKGWSTAEEAAGELTCASQIPQQHVTNYTLEETEFPSSLRKKSWNCKSTIQEFSTPMLRLLNERSKPKENKFPHKIYLKLP